MNRELAIQYVNKLKSMEDRDYLIAMIRYCISPVLEGVKPASIMNFTKIERDLIRLWKDYCSSINFPGISSFEIKKSNNSLLILFYNKEMLMSVMSDREVIEYLRKYGYMMNMSIEDILDKLREDFKKGFPHEIGILLGIPLNDVSAFIEQPNKSCLLRGYWKVYSNVEAAKEIFDMYDKAREKAVKTLLQLEN